MKVKELIETLKQFDPELPVVLRTFDDGFFASRFRSIGEIRESIVHDRIGKMLNENVKPDYLAVTIEY